MTQPTRSAGLHPGQRALVTGAGSGIGRAIAVALADEGLEVLLVGRDPAKLAATAAHRPAAMHALPGDITAAEGCETVARAAAPRLDVLVHSAGIYRRTRFAELRAEDWSELQSVNLHAPILLTMLSLTALRAAKGQVVFINSTAVLAPAAGLGAYAASKQALRAAADALRHEVNADGIRVLSVFPGRTDTPMQRDILAAEGREAAPGALMRPQDVASLVLAALRLPASAEVTEIVMRPMRPL